MAEILLSLTIIGVVAAITLPSLTGNINERTWNTQRKALYARMSQAISLMPALNGYGTLTEGDSSTSAVDTAAETFVTDGLSKVLKINNICDSEHLADCGITKKVIAANGSVIFNSFPKTFKEYNSEMISTTYATKDTKAAAFETVNGESIVVFYNPNCQSDSVNTASYYCQPKVCANFVYDLNGTKGPNTFGKDMGAITVFYPTDSNVVAPYPIPNDIGQRAQRQAMKACREKDSEYRLPNKEELASLFVNKYPWGMGFNNSNGESQVYWSSTMSNLGNYYDGTNIHAWDIVFSQGLWRATVAPTHQYSVRCVKR